MVSLDGGGVRGLSSLLILRLLLVLVTEELARRNVVPHGRPTLNPQDVFDIAVGTSTGGLIVLMMVKLNMSIDECIQQYKVLSSEIFAKERPALKRLFGSDWSKFSGEALSKAIEKLLASEGHAPDLKLRSAHANSMQGTVLCHEKPNPHPIFFCTHECQGPYRQQMLDCDLELRQAARATSAAPSYFEPMVIRGRSFTDGGIGETNNPSWEGKLHYHRNHGLREEERMVMINVGTGTLPEEFYEAHDQGALRPWWTRLVPNGLVNALGLVADLIHIATESEGPAARLAVISDMLPDQFFFERFSADTGIHGIKLDNWRAVTDKDGPSEIEVKTNTYLGKPEVRQRMVAAAKKLADVYVVRNS
ncbi:acyl transferase/acyl hydrolase/lysophospholipase, partial [Exophiala viscosa]|uniref:acyl transferase/acyl hydrolase/lysophospholipase n=1 Tax=Exophiala viscosa TaxID=2486360 RepID=UPI00219ECD4B